MSNQTTDRINFPLTIIATLAIFLVALSGTFYAEGLNFSKYIQPANVLNPL